MSKGKAKGTGDTVRSRLAELNFARNINARVYVLWSGVEYLILIS